jgi:ATP-dependent Lon protease
MFTQCHFLVTLSTHRSSGSKRRSREFFQKRHPVTVSAARRGRSSTRSAPSTTRRPGRHRRLRAVPVQRPQAGAAGDPRRRGPAAAADRVDPGHLAESEVTDKIEKDVREGMEKRSASSCCASSSSRDPQGARRGRARRAPTTTAPASRRPTCPSGPRGRAARGRQAGAGRRPEPRGGWIRTWLDTVLDLPWNVRTEDATDLDAARAVLDADHHGLDDVKDRIVEYLGVRARARVPRPEVVGGRGSGAVLLLAGPPGVGKTSLGESVARALGRKFVRVALGGVRDEAEIRGHRRTYVGALPGRIVRAIKEAGSMNPVVLLDEVDKVGATTAATRRRRCSRCSTRRRTTRSATTTSRSTSTCPTCCSSPPRTCSTRSRPAARPDGAVTLDGYTEDEKVAIARDHLLPRQLERAGLSRRRGDVTDDALREIAADYTREAGVRGSSSGCSPRCCARSRRGSLGGKATVDVDVDARPRTTDRAAAVHPGVGRAHRGPGRGHRPGRDRAGGDVLFIEASLRCPATRAGCPDRPARRRDEGVGADRALLRAGARRGARHLAGARSTTAIHVHVPAGAVPKDGPSAGVTMTTALVSLLTGRPVRPRSG